MMRSNGKFEPKPPNPKKNPRVWQSFLFHKEIMRIDVAHQQRLSFVESGLSNLDAQREMDLLEWTGKERRKAERALINDAKLTPIWPWLSSIRGIGENITAAQLIGLIDDIERFPTVSKLWRFAGYGVNPETGQIDRRKPNENSPYSGRLKGLLYNIGLNLVRQQTAGYVEIYYMEKARQKELHPEVEKIKVKDKDGKTKVIERFTPGHLDFRARRKMLKEFLKNLWVEWRIAEGLPLSEPYEERSAKVEVQPMTRVPSNEDVQPRV